LEYPEAVLRFLRRLRWRFGSLQRGDHTAAEERPVENTDAMAAAGSQHFDPSGTGVSGYPPGYVKGYDEGRPRH
jgi:hypothetical protein